MLRRQWHFSYSATVSTMLILTVSSDVAKESIPCNMKENIGNVQLMISEGTSEQEGVVMICTEVLPSSSGTVEMYKWSVINATAFNQGAAAAVCEQKQRNLKEFGRAGKLYPNTEVNVQYYLSYVQCPIVKNYSENGEVFLLRCHHSSAVLLPHDLPSDDFASVTCTAAIPHYNGQITWDLSDPGNKPVRISFGDKSFPICINETLLLNTSSKRAIGDSICRHLGYTETLSTYPLHDDLDEGVWYIPDVDCGDDSYSCFTDCFDSYKYQSSCDFGVGILVQCYFNEENQWVMSSGSKQSCSEQGCDCPSFGTLDPKEAFGTGFGAGAAVIILLIVSVGGIGLLVYWCRQRAWNGFNHLNDDQPQH